MQFYDQRNRLLAEVHARPSTPIDAPMLVTRIAALSGRDGAEADRQHTAALCATIGGEAPTKGMRWWSLDAGDWQVRWERHSEFSSWTFLRPPSDGRDEHAISAAPAWLDALPGPVLVLTTLRLRRGHHGHAAPADRHDTIGSRLLDGAATLLTDLKPDGAGMTRFDVIMHEDDPVLTGRLALMLLEIETYRLMALLAFPVATDAAAQLQEIESEAGALAARIADDLGVEDDRALLARLVTLSGRMESLSATTNFRFGAGDAYHEIVLNRIAALQEAPIPGLQTIGQFMERRLGPAMRTCATVAARERSLLDRLARAGQMLNNRIELVTQKINADLLHSMDRRALAQLRLQRTVEGLSVAAIAYYLISLLGYVFGGLKAWAPGFNENLALGLAAPVAVLVVWLLLVRIRSRIERDG